MGTFQILEMVHLFVHMNGFRFLEKAHLCTNEAFTIVSFVRLSEKFEMTSKNSLSTELTAIHTPDLYKERSNHSIMRRTIISKNECNW